MATLSLGSFLEGVVGSAAGRVYFPCTPIALPQRLKR